MEVTKSNATSENSSASKILLALTPTIPVSNASKAFGDLAVPGYKAYKTRSGLHGVTTHLDNEHQRRLREKELRTKQEQIEQQWRPSAKEQRKKQEKEIEQQWRPSAKKQRKMQEEEIEQHWRPSAKKQRKMQEEEIEHQRRLREKELRKMQEEEIEQQWRPSAKKQRKMQEEEIEHQRRPREKELRTKHEQIEQQWRLREKERRTKQDEQIGARNITSTSEAELKNNSSCSGLTKLTTEMLQDAAEMKTAAFIELDDLQSKLGQISYYLWNEKLAVHLDDEKAVQNQQLITAAVTGIARRFLENEGSVTVEVSNDSINAVLCSPKLGTLLTVNRELQTAGMYMLYGGVVHWVSVAHNYVRPTHSLFNRAIFDQEPLRAATEELALRKVFLDFGDEPLMATEDQMVLSPMSYPCLKHKPKDRMGRTLLHSVDIMVGQVPMVWGRNDARELENLVSLRELPEIAESVYRINKVWRPTKFSGNEHDNYSRYDITIDEMKNYKNVRALLHGNNLAEGTVISNFARVRLSGVPYDNVLLISSSNGISPRLGDSGSIWVARESSEAVAITVGKMTSRDQELWVAVLLFPCLEMICLEYNHTFADVKLFASLKGQTLVDDLALQGVLGQ